MTYPFCDPKTLCFYLAFVWFSRVYIVIEGGRNLAEKFRKEINKKDFRLYIDESRIEQQIVIP